jgi:radical SAM-linked protein
MLPESKLMEKARLRKLPELERPRTVRLKFKKVGSLQYISHLDLQRTFVRVIVRSCIPAWYTKGFNPHAKLVFSTPLSVGAQSVCEYLDIRIDRDMSCEDIKDRLNAELTDELCILDAYLPENDFSQIAWASYEIEVFTRDADESLAKKANEILTTSPLVMTKRTKSGEKDVDIIPMIKSADVHYDNETGTLKLSCVLSASSTEYLNPELLITALKQNIGILAGDPSVEWYTIMRTNLFTSNLKEFK